MPYRALARTVAAIHIAFVLWIALGALLVMRFPSLLYFHLASVLWSLCTMCLDLGCPLTPWEKQAWRRGGVEPYAEGFFQHYFVRRELSPAAARRMHIAVGATGLLINVVAYAAIMR